MKLLVDMNLSPRWVTLLNDAGFDAVHWSSVGAFDAPDSIIVETARSGNYVVLTNDLDFGAILATSRGAKPSVVQLRAEDINHHVVGQKVVEALRQMEPELAEGALVTIEPNRSRLRLLPLHRG